MTTKTANPEDDLCGSFIVFSAAFQYTKHSKNDNEKPAQQTKNDSEKKEKKNASMVCKTYYLWTCFLKTFFFFLIQGYPSHVQEFWGVIMKFESFLLMFFIHEYIFIIFRHNKQ